MIIERVDAQSQLFNRVLQVGERREEICCSGFPFVDLVGVHLLSNGLSDWCRQRAKRR